MDTFSTDGTNNPLGNGQSKLEINSSNEFAATDMHSLLEEAKNMQQDIIRLSAMLWYLRQSQLNAVKKEFINSKEVMDYLRISKRTLQNYRDKKIVRFYRINGSLVYRRSEIIELAKINANGEQGEPFNPKQCDNS